MCYTLFLSTDSDENLALLPNDHYRFEKPVSEDIEKLDGPLRHSRVWSITSNYGCGCHFRHLMSGSVDLGFGEPEDWMPEDEEDVAATQAIYVVFKRLVGEGHSLDLVDLWNGEPPADLTTVVVDVEAVGRNAFRFFEGCRFEFRSYAEGV